MDIVFYNDDNFSIQTDAWFEVISIVMQMAIWHTKHAANIAASDRCVLLLNVVAGVMSSATVQ